MKQLTHFLKIFFLLSLFICFTFSPSHAANKISKRFKDGFIFVGAEPQVVLHIKKISSGCNTSLTGSFVKAVNGSLKGLKCFERKWEELNSIKSFNAESTLGNDFPLFVEKPQTNIDLNKKEAYFLAKKDFNLPSFWKKNPEMDGRGVIVGVIDDGISPHAQGFQKTTTGQRKVIGHYSNSTGLSFNLKLMDPNAETELIEEKNVLRYWKGIIDEEKHLLSYPYLFTDLNRNKTKDKIQVWVFEKNSYSQRASLSNSFKIFYHSSILMIFSKNYKGIYPKYYCLKWVMIYPLKIILSHIKKKIVL